MMNAEDKLIKSLSLPIKTEKVEVNNLSINYATVGSGPPLLLLHGLNIGWGQWFPNLGELAKHYTVYALDLPGSGQSTKIDYKKSSFTRDYVDTVEMLLKAKKLKNVSIIAHSAASVIAVKLTSRKETSIEKIILVSPIGIVENIPNNQKIMAIYPLAALLSKTVMKPTKENMRKFLTQPLFKKRKLPEEFVDYYHQSVVRERVTHPFLFINSLTKSLKVHPDLSILSELASIKVPTLVVLGEKDPMIEVSKIHESIQRLPNVSVSVLNDTGHIPPMEDSDVFNQIAIRFLKN